MSNQRNPDDRYVWALAPIIETLANSARDKDPAAFSEAATMIDSTPGQIMRGIASFAWMASNAADAATYLLADLLHDGDRVALKAAH